MSYTDGQIDGTAYLVMRKSRRFSYEMDAVKATQKRPTVVDADCIVVKVKIRVPKAAFEPFQPEAVVEIPDSLVQHPIEVEADNAVDGAA